MVECTFSGPKDLAPEEQLIRTPGKWKLFLDGLAIEKKCGAGLILSGPDGFEIYQAIRFNFPPPTNNEAKYEALLHGMELARSLEVKHLRAFSNSMLVVKHFIGEYEQRDPHTKAYVAKKILGEAKGRWVEELPWVLWAYQTTPRSSTGETPFRLAYGTNVLVPVEMGPESYGTEFYNVKVNNFGLRVNVDLLEEEREASHQRNIKYLLQAAQHYDSGIKKRSFGVGDLVQRELAISMPTRRGKLQPN
ncbi:uncharacterized protein LOC141696177 [Apium graveolens]|uniref:uncharacterized protein LOC141696177 n=1 Tax=Apium graveolens TaxID=4045 RepID=UPI003D7A0C0E